MKKDGNQQTVFFICQIAYILVLEYINLNINRKFMRTVCKFLLKKTTYILIGIHIQGVNYESISIRTSSRLA